MKRNWVAAVVALSLALPGAALPGAALSAPALRGYPAADAESELRWESQFVDIPSAQGALDTVAAIGARPHYPGTPGDYALAVYLRDELRAAGIAAGLETFTARVDTPRELVLELAPPADLAAATGRAKRHARRADFPVAFDLREAAEPSDPATAQPGVGLPFNAGSGDGDVSAPLVYAGRGLDSDYSTLGGAGIDVRGAVLLVRYGAEFRGRLAERAQSRGAAGVIFYSDPQDDGAARGPVYPAGPWRPAASIERGWLGNGIHIPVLPISAANAQVLLGALNGAAGPAGWAGALPVAYPLARGPGRIHLIVRLNRKTVKLWNTVGVIPGIRSDRSVIVGAARDAWVYGAAADGAGIAALVEVGRGLGFLARGGWQPQRTIVIAGWDGAAAGWSGSGFYVGRHAFEIRAGCIAYLNADRPVTGPGFGARAVAALGASVADAARTVRDPIAPAAAVYAGWAAGSPHGVPGVDGPAAGGDAAGFLADGGTPIAEMALSGPFGVTGSSYDTFAFATRISDPGFGLHRAAAQLYGLLALRLADAPGLPYAAGDAVAPLLRALAGMAARPGAGRPALDLTAVRRSSGRLGAAAAAFDRTAPPNAEAADRGLQAVRAIDVLLYGAAPSVGVGVADIDAAAASGDPRQFPAVLARITTAIDGITARLGR